MKTILGILILAVTLSFTSGNGKKTSENGKLSGTVTYKESYELSDLADRGGKIYIVNEADIRSSQYADIAKVIETFKTNKSSDILARSATLDPSKIMKLQANFDALSKFTDTYVHGFISLPSVQRVSTDAKGKYAVNLSPGKYYILYFSGNVKSNNLLESRGNIDYKIVDIQPAGTTFVDVTFEKVENVMLLLMTAWQRPEGC